MLDKSPVTDTTACFSLWYYVDSESKFNLSLVYNMGTQSELPWFTVSGSQLSHTWQQVKHELGIVARWKHWSIVLKHDTYFDGGLAIDDIKLTLGKCHYDNGMECDFNDYSCGYQMSGPGHAVTGQSRGTAYGPAFDHTTGDATGKYYFFHKPANSRGPVSSSMTIPNLFFTQALQPHCLKFYYQINTPSTSSFYVYVMPNSQATTGSDRPDWIVPYSNFTQWTKGQLTVYAFYQHKIRFAMMLGATIPDNSFIAIDDVSLSIGTCESPVSCNFDEDFCSWANSKTSTANWIRFTGMTKIVQK